MVVNPAFLRFVIFPEFKFNLQAPGALARPVQWFEILSEGACLFVTEIYIRFVGSFLHVCESFYFYFFFLSSFKATI